LKRVCAAGLVNTVVGDAETGGPSAAAGVAAELADVAFHTRQPMTTTITTDAPSPPKTMANGKTVSSDIPKDT